MLGRLIEISVPAREMLASWNFYRRLGFVVADSADVWPHRYAVVTDGRLALGLHESDLSGPTLTYVHPELKTYFPRLQQIGLEPIAEHFRDDGLHHVELASPDGQHIRLIEARSFSPTTPSQGSLLGWFDQFMMLTQDRARAACFWERCGFIMMPEEKLPFEHVPLVSDTLNVGLHEHLRFGGSTLIFHVADIVETRELLERAGISPNSTLPPGLDHRFDLVLSAPEGTRLLLTSVDRTPPHDKPT
jgi:hypothetical protein